MAYQNVGTPRFYIDVFSTMKALDIPYTEDYKPVVDTPLYKGLWGLENCSMPNWNGDIHHNDIKVEIDEEGVLFSNLLGDGNRQNVYIALLNCKIGTYGSVSILPQFSNPSNILGDNHIASDVIYIASPWSSNIANFGVVDVDTDDRDISVHIFPSIAMSTSHIGAISMGNIYDMPVSPDLDLSMNIEFDGFDNTQTLNGGTLTNTRYMGSPWWYDNSGNKIEPWSVGESTGVSKRNGRRTWDLKFSYMSDKDLFSSNYGSINYLQNSSGTASEDLFFNTTNSDNIASLIGFSCEQLSLSSVVANTSFTSATISGDGGYASCVGTVATLDTSGDEYYYVSLELTNYEFDGSGGQVISLFGGELGNIASETSLSLSGDGLVETNILGTDNVELWFPASVNADIKIIVRSASGQSEVAGFQYTIDDDDSFSAQVLNKISHGQKFIFQPDNTNNNPDQFAICVLDQDSFSMKRTAHNVYDISMKIKEVW